MSGLPFCVCDEKTVTVELFYSSLRAETGRGLKLAARSKGVAVADVVSIIIW